MFKEKSLHLKFFTMILIMLALTFTVVGCGNNTEEEVIEVEEEEIVEEYKPKNNIAYDLERIDLAPYIGQELSALQNVVPGLIEFVYENPQVNNKDEHTYYTEDYSVHVYEYNNIVFSIMLSFESTQDDEYLFTYTLPYDLYGIFPGMNENEGLELMKDFSENNDVEDDLMFYKARNGNQELKVSFHDFSFYDLENIVGNVSVTDDTLSQQGAAQ